MRRIGLVVLLFIVASCGDPAADRVPGPDLLEEEVPETVAQVSVTAAGFEPDEVTLEAGQGIELTNATDDDIRAVGGAAGRRRLDTGTVAPDETTVIVFEKPDRYELTLDGQDEVGLVVTAEPAPEDG